MNEWLHAFWLAILQGLTEFLPISSSGHLALVPWILGWKDQGLVFDVAVHVGTLVAVIIYFRQDLRLLLVDWFKSILGGPVTAYSKLAWFIAFATILVSIMGVLFEKQTSNTLRSPVPIAVATIIFGVLLGLVDKFGLKRRELESIGWIDVFFIGAAQGLALIPGTSRSGITISVGLLMGLTREASTRFSFLMAVPVIALAGGWQTLSLVNQKVNADWGRFTFALIVSAVVALACIHYFLLFVKRLSLMPFVIYRIILGVILMLIFM